MSWETAKKTCCRLHAFREMQTTNCAYCRKCVCAYYVRIMKIRRVRHRGISYISLYVKFQGSAEFVLSSEPPTDFGGKQSDYLVANVLSVYSNR